MPEILPPIGQGIRRYVDAGKIKTLPKMIGFQAEGAAPIVRGHVVDHPETVATAIRIGNPASWKAAEAARDESGGLIDMVSDQEILDAYQMVSSTEGIFCEPASAASIAGVIKKSKEGYFPKGARVVCTLTGHGLKDPDNAIKVSAEPVTCEPEMKKCSMSSDSETKFLVLVPDGMADLPVPELGDSTPLQAAKTPWMDRMAAAGTIGMTLTVPEGLSPGSDVANLSIMGYDPQRFTLAGPHLRQHPWEFHSERAIWPFG